MTNTVDAIKERLSITDVIGTYVKLEKAGSNMRARCPFHQEKTPSFFISPVRNTYYCFGCGAKGDIFSFVEQFEGLDFSGALKLLAERAGVPLRFEKTGDRSEKEKLHEVLEVATVFFEKNFKEHPAPQEYLKKRGLTEKTIADFRIGYALPEWRSLSTYLVNKDFSPEIIEKAGLTKEAERGAYDRFRSRIMFPIFDTSGRTIGFSGRIFEDQRVASRESSESAPAKYLNSPETALFSKSHVLYGFNRAKEAIRHLNFVILVEGQMDLLMSHQMGYSNTVAVSGTALTDSHLALLERLTTRIVLSFDADTAGIAAAGRSSLLALARGMDVKAVKIEGGKDPADLILVDPEAWKKAVREARHVVDFFLDIVASQGYDERKFRMEVSRLVLPYVAAIRNSIDRAHFSATIASRLSLPESAIVEEVNRLSKEQKMALEGRESYNRAQAPASTVLKEVIPRKEMILRKIVGILLSEKSNSATTVAIDSHMEMLKGLVGEEYLRALMDNEAVREGLIFEAEEKVVATQNREAIILDLLVRLEDQVLRESRETFMREQKVAERNGNQEEVNRLSKEIGIISQKIFALDKKLRS